MVVMYVHLEHVGVATAKAWTAYGTCIRGWLAGRTVGLAPVRCRWSQEMCRLVDSWSCNLRADLLEAFGDVETVRVIRGNVDSEHEVIFLGDVWQGHVRNVG